jgi:hypothetical protein
VYGAGRSRITHPFATLTQEQAPGIPFDLHVLSTPPAFILSQNRTLHKKNFMKRHRHDDSRNKKIDDRLIRKGASHKNLTVLQGLPATRKERTMNWQSLTIKK